MGRPKGSKNKKQSKKNMPKNVEKNEEFNTKVAPLICLTIGIVLLVLIYLKSGILGEQLSYIFGGLFGIIEYFIPLFIIIFSIKAIIDEESQISYKSIELFIFVLAICSIFGIISFKTGDLQINNEISNIVRTAFEMGVTGKGGGAVGIISAYWLYKLFGFVGSIILSICISLIFIVFSFGIDLTNAIRTYINNAKEQGIKSHEKLNKIHDMPNINDPQIEMEKQLDKKYKEKPKILSAFDQEIPDKNEIMGQIEEEPKEKKADPEILESNIFITKKVEKEENTRQVLNLGHTMMVEDENYEFPTLNLLSYGQKLKSKATSKQLAQTSTQLQKTLYSFGVSVKVEDVSVGPSITRYELRPAEGVRVSKIANLADDIALNLAAETIRIEAPIPGKQAVGIEIPNKQREAVHLRDALESDEFRNSASKTTVALGKGVAGNVEIADISKMPHVLIAGSTGSGKSVCINTIITSIIYKAKPSEVKFVMIDPKVVELSVYNGIPHLLIPVVTDPKKAAGALSWAVQEMENRYQLFAKEGVRDIKGYNSHIETKEESIKLPQIVIIIDELADLMMVAKNDVEDAIVRLAQKARAAGMYLVIATQRPSVDVITGLIKANVPSRIAFAVSSQIDSRTILDSSGAEKLLGKGDMLYAPVGCSKPSRIQGAFVTDDEVEKVVGYLKNNGEAVYDENIISSIENQNQEREKTIKDDEDQTDPLLEEAINLILENQTASTSLIQRRFKVGYARAGRIIDQIEQRGIISKSLGPKPREVLMTKEQYKKLCEEPEELESED